MTQAAVANPLAADLHVAIIGGGISGLAAAFDLARSGVQVTIIEADGRFGGKLRTSPFAGRMVDEGADAFLLRVPWAVDMCRELGATDDLVHPAARTAYVWSYGELRPLPPQHMGVPTDLDALAAAGLVSPAGVARARRDLEAPAMPFADDPSTDDRAIGEVIEARLGREVLERLVDPLVGGINAGDTRQLSLDAVVPQIAAAARDRDNPSLIQACLAQQRRAREAGADSTAPIFAAPAGGMERLVDRLAAAVAAAGRVTHRLGERAEAIEGGPPWRIVMTGGDMIAADAVVVALPAHAMSPLLAEVAPEPSAMFESIAHASVAIVTFAFPPEAIGRPLDRSGFLVPRVETMKALSACSWTSTKWAHLSPESGDGTVVVRASAGRFGDERALDLDDLDLVAALTDDLARTMAATGAPAEVRVTRWPRSFPQYAPGHLNRVARAEAGLPPTVALAGAALRGVGVPACIHSGREAARRLLSALGPGE